MTRVSYTVADLNALIVFGSEESELAQSLHQTLTGRFSGEWPAESLAFSCDESDTDWCAQFGSERVNSPAIVFGLSQRRCEVEDYEATLIWQLVIKTCGLKAFLEVQSAHKNKDNMWSKETVLRQVKNMDNISRRALWDGSFFVFLDEIATRSHLTKTLQTLGCQQDRMCLWDDRTDLIPALNRFVRGDRSHPEMLVRKQQFIHGFASASLQSSGTAVNRAAALPINPLELRRALSTEVTSRVYAMVTSIAWPHLSFSLLPIMLPHIHWPEIVSELAAIVRSFAFLDAGEPPCKCL